MVPDVDLQLILVQSNTTWSFSGSFVHQATTNARTRHRIQQATPNGTTNNQTTSRMPKNFVSGAPLLEAVKPLRTDIPVSTQLLERIPKGLPYPKFLDLNGTCLTTICFCSAFAAPQNCCDTSMCKERRLPRQTRFHVDPSAPEWTSKPESYWNPLVAFLVDPQVSLVLHPSKALKALTPSTNWP
jgi:hypothetical protein